MPASPCQRACCGRCCTTASPELPLSWRGWTGCHFRRPLNLPPYELSGSRRQAYAFPWGPKQRNIYYNIAPVDTTFAMYRKENLERIMPNAVRLLPPLVSGRRAATWGGGGWGGGRRPSLEPAAWPAKGSVHFVGWPQGTRHLDFYMTYETAPADYIHYRSRASSHNHM